MFNFQSKKLVFCPIFSPLTNFIIFRLRQKHFFSFPPPFRPTRPTTAPRLRSGTQCFGRMSVTFKVRRGRGQFSGLCSHPKRCSGTFSNCLSWNGADVLFVCLSVALACGHTRQKKTKKKRKRKSYSSVLFAIDSVIYASLLMPHQH